MNHDTEHITNNDIQDGTQSTTPIARLNDQLRVQHVGGRIMITSGISALGQEVAGNILIAIARFDAFTPANDPYGEHDCAIMEINGHHVLWKIDYYDETLSHSPDPADLNVTVRVMTVMLAEEY